jgi:hypothetical protein
LGVDVTDALDIGELLDAVLFLELELGAGISSAEGFVRIGADRCGFTRVLRGAGFVDTYRRLYGSPAFICAAVRHMEKAIDTS